MKTQPKPSQIVIMASGAVCFIFSFLAFVKVPGDSKGGWGSGIFPFGAFVGIFGLACAVVVALALFSDVKLPDNVLTFNTKQLLFILAFTSAVIMISFLLIDYFGADKGIGLYLCLLGSIGLVVGTVMELLDTSTGTTAPPPPGQPGTPF